MFALRSHRLGLDCDRRADAPWARLPTAAPGALVGSKGAAQAPGLKTKTPSFARPPTS